MALYEYATREENGTLLVGPELVEVRCNRCGEEAFPHLCFAEWSTGKHHHHGEVHDLIDGNWRLVPLCDHCHYDYAHECIDRKEKAGTRQGSR